MSEIDRQIRALEAEVALLENELMATNAKADESTSNLVEVFNSYKLKEDEYNDISNKAKVMADELTKVDNVSAGVFSCYRKAKENLKVYSEQKVLMRQAIQQLSEAEQKLQGQIDESEHETKAKLRKMECDHHGNVEKLRKDIDQMQIYMKVCDQKRQNIHDDLERKKKELQEFTDICDELVQQQQVYSG